MIYHVTSRHNWEKALADGYYANPSLEIEGFIHCSKLEQVEGVLHRYFTGQKDLLLLHIEEKKLSSPLKIEWAPSVNEEFPHVFGPINFEAVIETSSI